MAVKWFFKKAPHKDLCEDMTIYTDSEEVRFCPKCFLVVVEALRRICECTCHQGGFCEGFPFICQKCGNISKVDVLYMTRQQTERHPKE